MAFGAKVLADGQLADVQTTIYTVPASTKTYVRSLRILNTNAASQTIVVWLNTSGTSRKVSQFVLAQNEWAIDFDLDGLQLEDGDIVEGASTNPTAVDYVLMGIEEA